jgi:hypothetical protein
MFKGLIDSLKNKLFKKPKLGAEIQKMMKEREDEKKNK